MTPRLWSCALAFWLALPAGAAPVRAEHVEAELVAEQTAWLPGSTQWIALRLQPEAGWHTYWRNPGDSGLPTTLAWNLPPGFAAGDIAWPWPEAHRLGDLINYGYGEDTLHLVPLTVPKGLQAPEATVAAQAKWLVCKDICIPGSAELTLTLPVKSIATTDPRWAARFQETRERLPAEPPLPGRFAVAEGEVRLAVEAGEGLAGAAPVEFFPYANNLVNHAAPQRVAVEGGVARFAQAQSAFLPGAPERVEGVLVVRSTPPRGYAVSAGPGEVATVAAAPAPVAAAAAVESASAPAAAQDPGLLLALGFALLGGLILNLMPCVFPVLAIKAVSVLESRRGDAAAERAHALAYAAGVVLSCVAVAGVLLLVRGGGELLGWGFQLQAPAFVALLAYLMLALGLSLSGVVQLGTRLMGVGQSLAERGGYAGSFFTGVLAVVVATPCTGPFMGAALGYALAQPALVAVLVFATLGLGLALPFLLIGFFPALGAWLPRPGAWMETFKQLLAFPLYLTAVWLLWVLGRQAGIDAVALVLCGLVLVALALWSWGAPPRSRARAALALLALVGALALLAHPLVGVAPGRAAAAVATADARHGPYSDARLAELRAQRRIVFVNFTADWCITCKVNERGALDSERVHAAFAERNVAWLTADWTTADPAITAALARFGRSGVPLYLLYPPGGEPVVLPQLLTPEILTDALASLPQGG